MFRSIAEFFNSDDFMPHGHCFLWQPDILWLHILSDAGIVFAYYTIPLVLIYFIRNRKDLPFKNVFWLFGAFILLCGTTHLLSIWVLWHPDYAVEGVVKAATALASIATLVATIKIVPAALRLVSPEASALADSEMRLRAVVDNTAEGMITIDERGIIQTFNKACERIFGYRPDEVLGNNIKMLMPEPTRGEHDGYIDRYKKTGEGHIIGTVGREVEGRRKDGTVFPLELSISVISVGGKRIFSGILRDISARRKAEEAKALLAAIVESSDDAIISKNLDGIITSWNMGAERLFGYSGAEAIGQSTTLIIPDERKQEEQHILSELRMGKPIDHYETTRVAKDGHCIDVSLTISPIHDSAGRIIGASKVAHDISQRKQAEQRMEQLITELTESNTQLERFAYVCSHDLQEPLRMISNYTDRLAKYMGDGVDEKGRHYMKYITDGANNARALIADILAYARIGTGTEKPEAIDCNEILKRILTTLESAIQDSHAVITSDTLPVITGHTTQILQLFQNLLTNAIKFRGSEPSRIHIGVRQKNIGWEFSVSDNGIGIAPEYRDRIFIIFQRLNKRGEYPGTGIGLAICKKIIEQQGGRIWLESEPGKGTTFFFTLNEGIRS